jgi:hypothetical protein
MGPQGRLLPYWIAGIALVLLAGARVGAQPAPAGDDVFFEAAVPPPPGMPFADSHVQVLSFEEGFETKQVKGAPYQAEAVTEIVQALADGNRIVRKQTSIVARDGEGRTRRETSVAAIGTLGPADAPRTAFISDPVAGTRYVLELDERVARKLPAPPMLHWDETKGEGALADVIVVRDGGKEKKIVHREVRVDPAGEAVFVHGGPDGKRKEAAGQTESLGTQVIGGVEAQGTRHTVTIPAGQIGNERPIEIVSERWYSPELQAVVLSRRSDPRMGETSYRLTNITRAEPDRALFEVPADFTVSDAPRMFRKRLHGPQGEGHPE